MQPPSRRRIVAVSPDDGSAIDLKQPEFAALLAWFIPGLGHFYQGRNRKGAVYMSVILTLFMLALAGMEEQWHHGDQTTRVGGLSARQVLELLQRRLSSSRSP